MLSYVHRSVDSSTHSNEHFSKVLARLNPDMTREQVHDVIEELVVETRVVMSSGMQLTEQLNIATTPKTTTFLFLTYCPATNQTQTG